MFVLEVKEAINVTKQHVLQQSAIKLEKQPNQRLTESAQTCRAWKEIFSNTMTFTTFTLIQWDLIFIVNHD